MAIDVTPNTVATNALQAMDFSSLIGGPMDAIIKAQALAAKTTYEFINEVCLTEDSITGEKKPINVTFTYNNNGKEATLTVPLLVILTIPSIEVSEFTIDFIANISAASSSTTETSSDTELGVDAQAEASLSIGPFSLKVTAKANYSSKQHSRAAQDSRYSVEYTMNVNVKGKQSDMPTGLQTVLNILQGSATTIDLDRLAVPYPKFLDYSSTDTATLQITVKDKEAMFVKGAVVDLTPLTTPSPFESITVTQGVPKMLMEKEVMSLRSNKRLNVTKDVVKAYQLRKDGLPDTDSNSVSAVTERDGIVEFTLKLLDSLPADTQPQGRIKVDVNIPDPHSKELSQEILNIVYLIPISEMS